MDSRLASRLPRISMLGFAAQASMARSHETVLQLLDVLVAHGLLQVEHQPGADGLDDGRRAALLAVGRIGQVGVLSRADVGHGAAARHRGHPVGQQPALDHQHARVCPVRR